MPPPTLDCDFFEVGPTEGKGTKESLRRLSIQPQELILGDAGYWSTSGMEFVRSRGADVFVRINPQTFVAHDSSSRRIGLLSRLRTLRRAGAVGEWNV